MQIYHKGKLGVVDGTPHPFGERNRELAVEEGFKDEVVEEQEKHHDPQHKRPRHFHLLLLLPGSSVILMNFIIIIIRIIILLRLALHAKENGRLEDGTDGKIGQEQDSSRRQVGKQLGNKALLYFE